MNAQEILKLYQTLAIQHGLPAMEPKTWDLSCNVKYLDTATATMALIKSFKPTTGWLSFQSITKLFKTNKELPVMDAITGFLLNAEVANTLGHSLHIRYNSADNWIATQFIPSIGSNYLVDNVKFIVHDNPDSFICYKRFWRIDVEQGIVPDSACFILIT